MTAVTGAELAVILGVARSHITRLKQDGKLTPSASGKFDLASGVQQYITYLKEGKLAAVVSDRRAKLLAEQERRLRHQNDLAEGRVAPIEDYDQATMEALAIIASRLNGYPGRVAAVVAGMTDPALIRAYLQGELDQVRTEAADHLEAFGREKAA